MLCSIFFNATAGTVTLFLELESGVQLLSARWVIPRIAVQVSAVNSEIAEQEDIEPFREDRAGARC
jgi:hypothetical protein